MHVERRANFNAGKGHFSRVGDLDCVACAGIDHCIQTVGLSSALQMWAPSWPSVCNTSMVGVHAIAALCLAGGCERGCEKEAYEGVGGTWRAYSGMPVCGCERV